MIELLIILITTTLFSLQSDLIYQVMDNTVICNNAISEHHYVSDTGYETVICKYKNKKDPRTLVFVLPPSDVSNTVSCRSFGKKKAPCPSPWRIESSREFIPEDESLFLTTEEFLNRINEKF